MKEMIDYSIGLMLLFVMVSASILTTAIRRRNLSSMEFQSSTLGTSVSDRLNASNGLFWLFQINMGLMCFISSSLLLMIIVASNANFKILNYIQMTDVNRCKAPKGLQLLNIYGNLGTYNRTITCRDYRVQALFGQGLVHLYGFNLIESARNFQAAIELDQLCLMCYIGALCCRGSNINEDMNEFGLKEGLQIIDHVLQLISLNSTIFDEKEIAIFQTHRTRFPSNVPLWHDNGQMHFTKLYSIEMGNLARLYPDDVDIISWYGESLMNLSPWRYFEPNGTMKSHIQTAVRHLQYVISRVPGHPLALHLLIHIYEQSATPTVGEVYADKLASSDWTHGSSHLTHMPAHMYLRVGRYDDCVSAGKHAVARDVLYMSRCLQPYVPLHNRALLVYGALACGDMDVALEHSLSTDSLPFEASSQSTADLPVPKELIMARFGKWSEILRSASISTTFPSSHDWLRSRRGISDTNNDRRNVAAEVDVDVWLRNVELNGMPPYFLSIHLYTVTLALVGVQLIDPAKKVFKRLSVITGSVPTGIMPRGHPFYSHLPEIARLMNYTAYASIAMAEGQWSEVVSSLRFAVNLQDSFSYMEPEHFYIPLKQCLGAVLSEIGRRKRMKTFNNMTDLNQITLSDSIKEAYNMFRADLVQHPNSPWSLRGMAEVTSDEERAKVYESFRRFWRGKDLISGACCELNLCH